MDFQLAEATWDCVRRAINLGQWKYSWHNSVKGVEDLEKLEPIIDEMIKERKNEIVQLEDALVSVLKLIEYDKPKDI